MKTTTTMVIVTSVLVVAVVVVKAVRSMFLIRSHIHQQALVMNQMVMGFSQWFQCHCLRLMYMKNTGFGMVCGIWIWKDKEALMMVLASQGNPVSRTWAYPFVNLTSKSLLPTGNQKYETWLTSSVKFEFGFVFIFSDFGFTISSFVINCVWCYKKLIWAKPS